MISITFPFWNSNIGATGNELRHFIRDTPACVGVTNINTVLTCSYSSSTRILTVSGGFSTTRSGSVTITVSNIWNPANPQAVSGFIISTTDSSGGIYEENTNTLSVRVSTPNIITSGDAYITSDSRIVNTSTTLGLGFILTNPLSSGSVIEIIFPSQLTYTTITVTGLIGVPNSNTLSYTSKGSNTI